MTAPAQMRVSATMRRVNDLMWETLDRGAWTDPVPFFCECNREGCYRPVWLTPDEYEQGRRQPDWRAVAAGHRRTTG